MRPTQKAAIAMIAGATIHAVGGIVGQVVQASTEVSDDMDERRARRGLPEDAAGERDAEADARCARATGDAAGAQAGEADQAEAEGERLDQAKPLTAIQTGSAGAARKSRAIPRERQWRPSLPLACGVQRSRKT